MPPFPNQELQQGALLSALQQQLQGRQYNSPRPQGNGLENFQLFAGILNNFGNPNALPQTLGLIQEQRNRREDNARNDFLLETKLLETKLQAAQEDIKLRKQLINFDLDERLKKQGLEAGAFDLQRAQQQAPLELRKKQADAEGAEFSLGEARTLAPERLREQKAKTIQEEFTAARQPKIAEHEDFVALLREQHIQEQVARESAEKQKVHMEIQQAQRKQSLASAIREQAKTLGYDETNPRDPKFAEITRTLAVLDGLPKEAADTFLNEDRITSAARRNPKIAYYANKPPEPFIIDADGKQIPNPADVEFKTLLALENSDLPRPIIAFTNHVVSDILPNIEKGNKVSEKNTLERLIDEYSDPIVFETYKQHRSVMQNDFADIINKRFDKYKPSVVDTMQLVREAYLRKKKQEGIDQETKKDAPSNLLTQSQIGSAALQRLIQGKR